MKIRRAVLAGALALPLAAICAVAWPRRDHVADPAWQHAPRRIVDPASGQPYRLERLFVHEGDDEIASVLIRPDDERRRALVISVSGSGEGLEPADGPLQRRLVGQGYAVLRLGKKGVGASSGNWRNEDFADRARNVRAALDWAASRTDLDADRVVLYGHSQGGYVIPMVAGDPRVAALILAAGPARVVRDQIADEAYQSALRSGTGEAKARARAMRSQRWLDIALAGCGAVAYHYLCHVYRHDPSPALAALRKPVLALFGEHDPMVPPATNLERMRELLRSDPDARVVVLPRSNHMFWTSTTGLPDEYPRLLAPVAAFAHARADDPDHVRLSQGWPDRAPYATGYFDAIDAFLARHVPATDA